jgi:hypothetical protein
MCRQGIPYGQFSLVLGREFQKLYGGQTGQRSVAVLQMGEIPKERKLVEWRPVEFTFIAKIPHGVDGIGVALAVINRGGVGYEIVVCVDIVSGNPNIDGFAKFVINACIIA